MWTNKIHVALELVIQDRTNAYISIDKAEY